MNSNRDMRNPVNLIGISALMLLTPLRARVRVRDPATYALGRTE